MRKPYKEFYARLSEEYNEEEFVYSTASGRLRREYITQLLKKHFNSDQPDYILDVGCGGMPVQLNNYQIIGIDIGLASLCRARQNNTDSIFICGDADNLDFLKACSFGYAVLSETIEHLEEPQKCLKGIFNALKPGGMLLITCPNWNRRKPIMELPSQIRRLPVPLPEPEGYLHTAYKPEELKQMCQQAGFKTVEMGSFEKELRYWTKIPQIGYRAAQKIFGNRTWVDKLYHSSLKLGVALLAVTGLSKIMRRLVKNGRRSYIIVRKPNEAT